MKLWQIVAVVAAGILYGILDRYRLTAFFYQSTLYVFLPLLLFEAAWNLNYRSIKRFWRPIATLAGPGVAVTALIVAGALMLARAPLATALVTGAILSATDPIAVVAVFRRMRVPLALATIVECESLFNDAVAVVIYRGVLLATAGAATSGAIQHAVLLGIGGSIGGIAIGVAIAFGAAALLRNRSNAILQVAATIVCAYGAYFVAERSECSGIFATIACGIALRYYERTFVTLEIVEDVDRVWDVGALVANACVFFLVGASLDARDALAHPFFILAAVGGVAAARLVTVQLVAPARLPAPWMDVLRVAGLRGALSLALALALPIAFAHREEIIAAAFIVAITTIVASGLAVPRVVARTARRGFRS